MPEYIHPKAVNAALQPEAQNVQHFLGDFGIAPVEVGLFGQEGMVVVLLRMRVVFPSASTKARQPVVRRPAAGARAAPDIPVALGVVARRPRLNKPGMLVGTVIGDKIQDDFEVAPMRLSDQRGACARPQSHPGFCPQSQFRPASLVFGVAVVARQPQAPLVYLARPPPAARAAEL